MSCSDVQTIKAGDGSKLTFSFDFPYIFKSEIHVYFWNVTTKEWDEKLTTDSTYPWQITDANPTIVEFTSTAPPAPTAASVPNEATQDNVRIRRITKVDDIRALFNPGSAIRSNDLNKNFEQLRYAIQESGCQDVPEDLKEYLEEYYWDRYDNTLYDGDTWVSDDTKIASAEAIDDRIDSKINDAITTDIATDGTGITVTDDGDGTITLGLADIDLDRIKAEDIITLAEQNASPTTNDDSIFTSSAAAKRFDTIVQTDTPGATDYETGKTWLQNDDDLTLSVWNGSTWTAVTSGGTFINQPKVIYVDAGAGDDNNDGHRISRPKLTIRAALSDINADANGDGTIISVAPGIYAETLPLDIEKNDIAIIGQSLRTCIIHPLIPEADEGSYDVDTPHSQELQTMFRVNSGSYFQNLTFMGMKASGTRGASGSLYEDATHGLPPNQGWNFAFFPGATIRKSPYVQNCTNFSDSQINNVTFTPHTPGEGAAGDLDSAPTGGGILVDGSVPAADSPLRSIVADSYTHTALNGPGILCTNNGYMQATSSYAFFNHAHITCINGGQANLAASTSDFGQFALIADGRSPNPIFTSTVDGTPADGATTFNIDAPTAGTDLYGGGEDWFGDAERPATNMLVEVNSITYPILSATANGDGWTVEISRPNPDNRSENLGLNGALTDGAAVSFFLRSMIASSGHTMEYVGSGTDYRALPENGGVPDEDNQKIELNNGKIWTAITDHNGKFTIGGNQTDDPFFEVDQQLGFVTIPEGSIAFNLLSDETPQLGGNLDVNGNTITSTSNANVVIDPNGTGTVDVSTSRITNVTDPDGDQDAATKNYVDNFTGTSSNIGSNAVTTEKIADDAVTADKLADTDVTAGSYTSADITVDAQGRITAASSGSSGAADKIEEGDTNVECVDTGTNGHILFDTEGSERMRIDSSGRLLVGTSTARSAGDVTAPLQVEGTGFNTSSLNLISNAGASAGNVAHISLAKSRGTSDGSNTVVASGDNLGTIQFCGADGTDLNSVAASFAAAVDGTPGGNDMPGRLVFSTTGSSASSPTERMRIDSSGDYLFLGGTLRIKDSGNTTQRGAIYGDSSSFHINAGVNNAIFYSAGTERMRLDNSGRLSVGTSNARAAGLTVGLGNSTVPAAGAATASALFGNTTDNGDYGLVLGATSGGHGYLQAQRADGTATTYDLYIQPNGGLVGIGTAAPERKLEVVDTSSSGSYPLAVSNLIDATANKGAAIDFRLTTGGNSRGEFGCKWSSGSSSDGTYFYFAPNDGSTGNVERMRIDSSGRLLLQTTDSTGTQLLKVNGDTSNTTNGGRIALTQGRTSPANGATHGVLSFGTETRPAQVELVGFVDGTWTDGQYHPSGLIINCTAHNRSDATERVRITDTGEFNAYGDGSIFQAGTLQGSGTNVYFYEGRRNQNTGGTRTYIVYSNGNVQNTNNSYGSLSDQRLKENIVDATSQWDDIKSLQIRKYNFREATGHETHTQIGLIAQEAESVSPGLVQTTTVGEGEPVLDANGNQLESLKSINYSVLYMKAVKALQEAMTRIETLETKVASLEAAE